MTDTIDQVREALAMMIRCAYPVSTDIDSRGYQWSEAWLDDVLPIAKAALSRPAPDVPGAEEVEQIRARHEACENEQSLDWIDAHGPGAHTDRATLLALLDAARAELAEAKRRIENLEAGERSLLEQIKMRY